MLRIHAPTPIGSIQLCFNVRNVWSFQRVLAMSASQASLRLARYVSTSLDGCLR